MTIETVEITILADTPTLVGDGVTSLACFDVSSSNPMVHFTDPGGAAPELSSGWIPWSGPLDYNGASADIYFLSKGKSMTITVVRS